MRDETGGAVAGEGMCIGEEMGMEGEVESMPEVVNCVKSSISENCTRAVFLDAYVPKCTERLRCSTSAGGGYAWYVCEIKEGRWWRVRESHIPARS